DWAFKPVLEKNRDFQGLEVFCHQLTYTTRNSLQSLPTHPCMSCAFRSRLKLLIYSPDQPIAHLICDCLVQTWEQSGKLFELGDLVIVEWSFGCPVHIESAALA